jgi:spermidine synthase
MKPTLCIASTRTPDGAQLDLMEHDGDYSFRIHRQDLMTSRQHQSELELADLTCNRLRGLHRIAVLIGGLGMGYTLRRAEDLLTRDSRIVLVELLPDVLEWNRSRIGHLAGHPLRDPRVEVVQGDVARQIREASDTFDAILLDIDNGPDALTHPGNRTLYSSEGLAACRRALREDGALAIWSAASDKRFESRLSRIFENVRRYRVPAYAGSRTQGRFIWVASESRATLPAGGGEPRPGPPSSRRPPQGTGRFRGRPAHS